MAKVTLGIIIDKNSDSAEEHAKKALISQRKAELRRGEVVPLNIPHASAVFPNYCDECGGNFWASSEYAYHSGCPGRGKGRSFGFNTSV